MTANLHRRTPALAVSDARGLPVRQVGYLRSVTADIPDVLVTRQQHDDNGRLVEQWDPRLSAPCLTTVYNLNGAVLKSDSVDAGWRLTLPGLAGEPLQRWDERGSHRRTTFDEQLRVMEVEENGEPNVDVFTYADASADAGYNRRGQLLGQKDRSGSLSTNSFSLTGQPLSEIRTFHDDQAFTSHHVFSPLGALLEQTDAGGHRRRSHYGLAGQLKQVDLWISGTPDWQPVLLDAQYNANDQIIEQLAGNRVLSQWTYDPADGRLHTQSSRKDGGAVLQNLEYFYDPVGNITRIEDHAFQPRYFANQLIDGHRDFTYDSLYRLTSATGYDDAPPPDIPGLPQPGDPNNRLNYTQTYRYDNGGNLIELCHVRAGNNSTRHMRIDPHSNRGVRWTPGEPEPVFDELFDPHGNQRSVQPGQPLQWNARDKLENVTLISRENARSDAEYYRYSQGMRVFKRHETFAANAEHFHQVRYLPGLEIRTRDNGEELHVISLGNARCLHWAKNKPDEIDMDQLRYSLEDHLGSCVMELDQQGDLTSQEGYYPFGETAWMAARHEVEVRYKFIRYSGKEMDVSGLYYYGARYYAPWLARWVSADPAGDVDGLNLYGFVGNNPLRFVDLAGTQKAESVIYNYSQFMNVLSFFADQTLEQLDNVFNQKNIMTELTKNLVGESAGALTTSVLGAVLANRSALDGSAVLTSHPYIDGLTAGNGLAAAGASAADSITSGTLIRSLIPQTSKISVAAIDEMLGLNAHQEIDWREAPGVILNPDFLMNWVVGSVFGIAGNLMNLGARVQEAEDIKHRLDPVKTGKIEKMLEDWKDAVETRSVQAEKAFDALGTDVFFPATIIPNVNAMTPKGAIAAVHRSALQKQKTVTLDYIARMQKGMVAYREAGTTDNQFLLKQARADKKKTA
ncbi:RHS repeat-associated core domain-containing protein [Pseudomonas sp. TNT2022 ID642]|uniref:RHS repeat-associated core domain-containing protein n=1 Tax=Pseudomonas sp. TNT2022 ID642 TaxID=2942632 RepID=UPI0023623184|nr:RHS repeat-associated core domain-containing protein [Pseudomonas sp. TNT2022 ID642]MDD1005144.1 toxin [Pseudomonas sp. TNT2022 ID642]